MSKLFLYNSLTKQKEEFKPFNPPHVGLYTCGFTVYDHAHIGHIKKYVGDDILRRVLIFNGYDVKHVQNVTDVGHLVSDEDAGEDKMEKGARKYNLNVYQVAQKFLDEFYETMDDVNAMRPTVIERATDDKAIAKQIEFITILLDKGYAYKKDKAIYFDISKLPLYNPFSKLNALEKQQVGAREDVEVDDDKKNPSDFVLWFFRVGKFADHAMHWDSPWGDGFPGWHIECSAISIQNLGDKIDIHTGGIEHKEVHHPNEIAQNYAVLGHNPVKLWLHHNFLTVDGKKMSKSLGNFYTLLDVRKKGFNPMIMRYFVLTANYRSQINFTWDAIEGMQAAYNRLLSYVNKFRLECRNIDKKTIESDNAYIGYLEDFTKAINNDLNTPEALAVMWSVVQDNDLKADVKLALLAKFDEIFGLKLIENAKSFNEDMAINTDDLDDDIRKLVQGREEARKNKDYAKADELKAKITVKGYKIEDSSTGTIVLKR